MSGHSYSRDQPVVENVREEMEKIMNEAVLLVRDQADRVEKDVVTPVHDAYVQLARRYPVIAVFFGIFTLLSLFPIMGFCLCSAFTLALSILVAVWMALFTAGSIIVVTGFFLLMTISFLFGLAIFLTTTYIAASLAYRLAFHLASKDGQGLNAWVTESLHWIGVGYTPPEPESTSDQKRSVDDINPEERIREVKTEEGSGDEWAAVDHTSGGKAEEKDPLLGPSQQGPTPEGPAILG